ncbi:undecaprenyl-diphosphate phosphatase [Nocardia tengchongensis]|uniref:undecaprenyl-diphosphate phosphatase n=1 Tax=Nocardia tengchongensis TaxID=2055889 RepID=UPI00340A095B
MCCDRPADAARRFWFLPTTPVILSVALLKTPELFKPHNHDILGPAAAGPVVAGMLGCLYARFMVRYFETKTPIPFAVYCLVAGARQPGRLHPRTRTAT